jgi:hypothetical protein
LHDCRKQTALACADPHNLSMRPRFEQVTVARGQSWTLYDGQLPSCPFNWHYHPEFELTLTLNSIGERFVGDHVAHYGDGDLVLVGPNLPHAWQSRAAVDTGQPQRALVLWFTQQWAQGLTTPYPELSGIDQLLAESPRGLSFSPATVDAMRPRLLAATFALARAAGGALVAGLRFPSTAARAAELRSEPPCTAYTYRATDRGFADDLYAGGRLIALTNPV